MAFSHDKNNNIISLSRIIGRGILFIPLPLAAMLVVVSIVMRLFGSSLPGVYELIELTAVLFASFAVVMATIKNTHIKMTFLSTIIPGIGKKVLYSFTSIIGFVIWLLIAWEGLQYAHETWLINETGRPLEIPIAPFRYIWAISAFIVSIVLFKDLLKTIRRPKA